MKSNLSTKEILSPNYNKRNAPVLKFTPHHTAVVAPAENIARGFQSKAREASSNYVIGGDGTIILCVPEEYRAWTSGNADNDHQAITVEVCNSTGAPDWKVSDAALEALINLGVDICKRYNLPGFTWTGNKNGTLTIHKMFQATACPGPYLESKMPYIAEEITKRINQKNDAGNRVQERIHIVKVDETLSEIAAKYYKMDWKKIAEYNGIKPPYTIYPGQEIIVSTSMMIKDEPKETVKKIDVGSTVRVKQGAKDYNGNGLASFIYNRNHKVSELKGDRAVITFNGVIVAAIKVSDLILI